MNKLLGCNRAWCTFLGDVNTPPMTVDAINVTWRCLCVCGVSIVANKGPVKLHMGGGGWGVGGLCKCMIVQVSVVSSELPSITAREQGSHPVNVSLISQSEGFSMGLFIPRGSKSVMKSPLCRCCKPHALERKCQLMGSDASPLEEWGWGGGGGEEGWNIDLKLAGGKGNESESESVHN